MKDRGRTKWPTCSCCVSSKCKCKKWHSNDPSESPSNIFCYWSRKAQLLLPAGSDPGLEIK
eukprot:scaffold9125_cov71-Skeletonema_dohrnii-CCMP3373.AAC.1